MRKRRWEGGGRGKVGENSGEREEDVGMKIGKGVGNGRKNNSRGLPLVQH